LLGMFAVFLPDIRKNKKDVARNVSTRNQNRGS